MPQPQIPGAPQYRPGSPEARELFRQAAATAGLPVAWADSAGLHNILARESQGFVGRPNYTYGERARAVARWPEVWTELRAGTITAKSSATGLGQLILRNVDAYYPNGRQGIGHALAEAVGMLRYIKARYGTPDEAWRQYGKHHEGY